MTMSLYYCCMYIRGKSVDCDSGSRIACLFSCSVVRLPLQGSFEYIPCYYSHSD